MFAKELGVIVIIALIAIGAFIILAPEYQKKAELEASLFQTQMMCDRLQSEIIHKRKIIAKLEANNTEMQTRMLREQGFCKENESIIQFNSHAQK